MRRPLAVLSAGLALLAAAAACRQIVGIGDEPPTDVADSGRPEASVEAGPKCGLAYAGASCESCLEHHCCAQLTACSGVSACSAFETCAATCKGDPDCRARCFQSHRSGTDPTIAAVESCLVNSCAGLCGVACGGVGQFAAEDAGSSCQQCFVGQGCSAAIACLSNPRCSSEVFCAFTAPTPDTQSPCAGPADAGLDVDAGGFQAVATNQCLQACGFDSNWSCVGHVEWPAPVKGEMSLQVTLFNAVYPFIQQAAGVTAKLCEIADTACDHPGAVAQSDMNGTVTLTTDAGVGNYYVGYVDLSGGGIVPELFFWSFPIGQDPAILGSPTYIPTVTPAQLDAALQGLHVGWDAGSTGIVSVRGLDCYQIGAEGLSFGITPSASPPSPFYFGADGVSVTPGLTQTTSSGYAVFTDVPSGTAVVTASLPAFTAPIGTYSLLVRPGTFSFVLALPSP